MHCGQMFNCHFLYNEWLPQLHTVVICYIIHYPAPSSNNKTTRKETQSENEADQKNSIKSKYKEEFSVFNYYIYVVR